MPDAVIKGTVHHLSVVENVGAKNMPKRTLVVETEGRYPQYIPIEASGDKVRKFDNLQPHQQVSVGVYINGRQGSGSYEGRYFLNLEVENVQSSGAAPTQPPGPGQQAHGQPAPFGQTQPAQQYQQPATGEVNF